MSVDYSNVLRLEQEQRFREDLLALIQSMKKQIDDLQKAVNELTAQPKAKLLKE